jgi:prepilin signal peptidase PulO-like enzyme (type II secretory pathway)
VLAFSLIFALIAFSDLRFRIIPKGLNFVALAILASYAVWERSISIFTSMLAVYILYGLIYRSTKGKIGYGDVRLAPMAVTQDVYVTLQIHSLAWILAGFLALFHRDIRRAIPFAPFLFMSTLMFNGA